jgi:RNA polymerase sigma-70 factor (ECF subfamily)
VLDGLGRFEGRSSLKTWVFRILTNRAKSWGKRAKRSVPFSLDDDLGDEPAVDPARFTRFGNWVLPPALWQEQTPEDILLQTEAGAALAREIENLPPAQRAVVALRDVDGFTADEVCEILALTEANQRVLLHRGRSKLRSAMERYLTRE